ncbi:hypothetical protein BEP19_10395 [Ammoniphilus oxalaticus]|uniref:Anti-sigma-W factor RsiW n=1 Tax=Ammoniphilus oxalaticus TaxID=66863 RepID=A0A419SFU8_9BACL|nr:zf-HC2 domain-containing protein [Ammoniphilus oxalaticus]RKD22658.1 hypothetical protein BEP19_10395 [Ammoniphilus oxalaticus]
MDCKQAISLIHDYLDEDLARQEELELKRHLMSCSACKQRFQSLQHTVAFVQSASRVYAPLNFTDQVLAALPKESYPRIWKQKMRRHPLFVTGSLLFLLLIAGLAAHWTSFQQFQLTSDQLYKLQIDESSRKVIVPSSSVVDGDILIRNADLEIKGKVLGNVTVIDGNVLFDSTGSVGGKCEEINRAVEWVWFHIKRIALQIIP